MAIPSTAGQFDLLINQYATYQVTFTWQAGTSCSCNSSCNCPPTNALPVDLTGYTADMEIKLNVNSPTVLYQATTSNGAIVLGGTAGTIALTIPASSTAGFTFVRGVYDMNLTSSAGVVTRLIQGNVIVSPAVTTS